MTSKSLIKNPLVDDFTPSAPLINEEFVDFREVQPFQILTPGGYTNLATAMPVADALAFSGCNEGAAQVAQEYSRNLENLILKGHEDGARIVAEEKKIAMQSNTTARRYSQVLEKKISQANVTDRVEDLQVSPTAITAYEYGLDKSDIAEYKYDQMSRSNSGNSNNTGVSYGGEYQVSEYKSMYETNEYKGEDYKSIYESHKK